MRLCQTCTNFDLQHFKRPGSARLFSVAYKDIAFNSSICDLCSLIFFQWPQDKAADQERKHNEEAWVHLIPCSNHTPSTGHQPNYDRLCVRLAGKSHAFEQEPWKEFWPYIIAELDSPAVLRQDVSGSYPGQDPRSETFVHLIHGWVGRCDEEHGHKSCWKSTTGASLDRFCAPLPARCLDVSRFPELTLQDTTSEEGVYIILSHRWNGPATEIIKTTPENVQQRYQGFQADDLTEGLRDAAELTHLLGIRYIWIDALCIIQGPDGDFQHEATRMLDYYENAYFTLSIALPSGPRGFLGPHTPIQGGLVVMPYYDAPPTRALRGWYCIVSAWKHDFDACVSNHALHNRGWVFQEDMISRRILHVTDRDMWFECASEGPRDAWNTLCAKGNLTQARYLGGNIEWHKLVERYSRTELSHPSKDSILALSGIAQGWGQMERGKVTSTKQSSPLSYFAGLWLDQVHLGLLWHQDTNLSLGPPQPSDCGAPTWSWAAHTFIRCQVESPRIFLIQDEAQGLGLLRSPAAN